MTVQAGETNWVDELAIITGAAGAMGGTVVRALLERGARVVGLDREHSLSADPVESDRYTPIAVDLSSRRSVVDAFGAIDEIGTPTMAATFAAVPSATRFAADATEEEWERIMSVNLAGSFWVCQQALGRMMPAKKGSIVLISSLAGHMARQTHNTHLYSISKAGVIGMTRTLAAEAGSAGVRVNCIAPGLHDSRIWQRGTHTKESWELYTSQWIANSPLHRVGQPDDMVGPTLFFLGAASANLTGQVVMADGGKSIWF